MAEYISPPLNPAIAEISVSNRLKRETDDQVAGRVVMQDTTMPRGVYGFQKAPVLTVESDTYGAKVDVKKYTTDITPEPVKFYDTTAFRMLALIAGIMILRKYLLI